MVIVLKSMSLYLGLPAGVREEGVLAPVSHVAMVIPMVHALCAVLWVEVVGGVTRGPILAVGWSIPLPEPLLGGVGIVEVADDSRFGGWWRHGHVEHSCVVLGCVCQRQRGRAGGWQGFQGSRLGILVWHCSHIQGLGFEAGLATALRAAGRRGGRGGRLTEIVESVERYYSCLRSGCLYLNPVEQHHWTAT